MKKYEKWTVALELTDATSDLLKNVAKLAAEFVPTRITLIHVIETPDLPKVVLEDIPGLFEPDIKGVTRQIKEMVKPYFHPEQNIEVKVTTGNALSEVLKWTNKSSSDLLLIGRGKYTRISALSQKLTRKSPCSVMLLPGRSVTDLSKVVVPIDFSEYSETAMSMVNQMYESNITMQVHVLSIYQDASRYLNQTFERADSVDEIVSKKEVINKHLHQHAEKELKEFLSHHGGAAFKTYLAALERGRKEADIIDEMIDEMQPDLVILGSRNKKTSAVDLLSVVSEEVVPHGGRHLTLVLKKKGETRNWLKNLFDL